MKLINLINIIFFGILNYYFFGVAIVAKNYTLFIILVVITTALFALQIYLQIKKPYHRMLFYIPLLLFVVFVVGIRQNNILLKENPATVEIQSENGVLMYVTTHKIYNKTYYRSEIRYSKIENGAKLKDEIKLVKQPFLNLVFPYGMLFYITTMIGIVNENRSRRSYDPRKSMMEMLTNSSTSRLVRGSRYSQNVAQFETHIQENAISHIADTIDDGRPEDK